MEKIVKSGIKVDFHIHSIYSTTKDSSQILKNSNKDNIPLLVRNLNAYGVQMCSITDHDTFDYDLYKALQKYEDDQSSTLVKILPGVEFSVMFNRNGLKKPIHVIALFSDDNENKLKNIEEVLKLTNNKPSYDEQDSFSEQKFIQILSDIDLDVVLIAHQKQTLSSDSKPKQNDANSLGEIGFNEFVTSEYFEAFEFKNKKNELFNNISSQEYGQDLLRFITGSDCHDWSVYPKHDASTNDDSFKHTYFKCLPTFKGVAFALTESNRISLENNFFTVDSNNYIDKIKAIVLIQIKIVDKYEDLITILLSQFWGNEARNQKCKQQIFLYINQIEEIVKQGIEKGEIKAGNPQAIASEIYGLICSSLVYKVRDRENFNITKLYKEFEDTIIKGLK